MQPAKIYLTHFSQIHFKAFLALQCIKYPTLYFPVIIISHAADKFEMLGRGASLVMICHGFPQWNACF